MLWQWTENCTFFSTLPFSQNKNRAEKIIFIKRLCDMLPIFIIPIGFEYAVCVCVSEFFLALPFLSFPFHFFSLCHCLCDKNQFIFVTAGVFHASQTTFFFALNGPRKIYSGKLIGFIFVCACFLCLCFSLSCLVDKVYNEICYQVQRYDSCVSVSVFLSFFLVLVFFFLNFFPVTRCDRECR